MDQFARTVFGLLFGWMQTLASMIWNDFYVPDFESVIRWIAEHWMLLVVILCLAGTGTDIFMRIRRNRKEKEDRQHKENLSRGFPDQKTAGPALPAAEEHNIYFASNRPKAEDVTEDLGHWLEEPDALFINEETTGTEAEVTPAGYTVPMDSPYRRPSAASVQEETMSPEWEKEEKAAQIRTPRRRRRLVELFTDEEKRYDAPLPLIDQHDAYHAPVYPRRWKETEKNDNEQDI